MLALTRSLADPGRPTRWVSAVTALALALLGLVVVAPAAQAAGTPNISASVSVPAKSLQGATVPVTVSATNSTGTPGYNLGVRLFVPTGATVSSSTPAYSAGPIATTGGAYYLWSNVSDLLVGTTSSVTAQVTTAGLALGTTLNVTGDAYVNSDPRTLPTFSAAGAPNAGTYTGNATAAGAGALVPFTITKDIIAPENELVRGVHDHRTAVTLRLDNSLLQPSSALTIVDYVPAELEFLGCGTEDNSSVVTAEYPGSGPLNATAFPAPGGSNGCPIPTSVDTLNVDPPGPEQGPGVYTVVTWNNAALATVGAGSLATAGTRTIHYVVGIPQQRNTVTFQGGTPTAASGDQGSNLDNNSGGSTIETSEQQGINAATLQGSYDDPNAAGGAATYSDRGVDIITLEDLALQKSVSPGTIVQGQVSTWTLDVQASEYTSSITGITLTDTMPDGLRVDSTNPAATSVVEQASGSTVITWSPAAFASMVRSETRQVTITTTTRDFYRQGFADDLNNPVRANDSWTNTTAITGTATEVINGVAQTPRTVIDDSSAGQTAGPISLKKYVRAPSAGSCDLAASLTGWVDDVHPTDFGPGDLVCWRIDVTTPANLDTSNLELTDFLPAGYSYVSSTTGTTSAIAFPAPTVAGSSITWDMSGVSELDQNNTGYVVVLARITDATAHSSADIVENLAKLAYRNTPGSIFQLREQADAPWKEPVLTLDKSASPTTNLNGGETVTYSLAITNSGDQDAVDVLVKDLLPTAIDCTDLTTAPTGLTGYSCVQGSPDSWSGTIGRVAAGATTTLTYVVTIPTSVRPAQVLTNTAGVVSFAGETNDSANQLFPYYPANSNPALVGGTANTSAAQDTQNVSVQAATVTKTRTTSVNETGNAAANQATPGEDITYTVTTVLPHATTLTAAAITDNVPATLLLDTSSVSVTGAPVGSTTTTTATQVLVTLPTPYTVGATDETITLTFTAKVKDVSGPVAGNTVTNSATLTATGLTTVTGSVGTTIVEPQVTTTKTESDADNIASPGELIGFTVTAGDAAGASPAHEVEVVDVIPTSMTPTDGAGVVLTDGQSVPSGGVWDAAARTLTWTSAGVAALGTVLPGTTVSLPYQVKVATPVPTPTSFTNTVTTTTRSLPAATVGERGPGSLSPTRYTATASVTLNAPLPSITKTVTPGTATIGEEVTYTLVATIPADVTTFDATIRDTLPAGMTYVATDSATCTAPVGCTIAAVTTLTPNGQNLGWFLGDLQTAAEPQRQVSVVYRARVADVAAAVDGATLTNSAWVSSNLTDKLGSPATVAGLGTFDYDSPVATAPVHVVEPHLTLVKQVRQGASWVDLRRVVPGETVTYRIVLTNTGTSTAYDVLVDDTTDARLGTVTNVTGATAVDVTAPGLQFSVASIAAGANVTITYDAVVPALTAADEVVGPEIANSALAAYSSLAGSDPNERGYATPADTAGLEADLASVGDYVWWDVDRDGVQDAGEPPLAGVDLTVTCVGPDGVAAAPDQVVTVTTDATGHYLAGNLPSCTSVTVTVDTSTLPAGLRTATATPSSAPLASGATDLGYDFGFAGDHGIGDLVWYDADGDGVQDAGGSEPGLAGIGVSVKLCGLDGLQNTADDVTVTTTTNASGAWAVPGVPDGCFTVTLDPATFPAGVAPVSDPDGGTADGVADGTMAGANDLTFDFGLRGDARLGDRVWLDANSDGVQGPVGDEPGISGATVQATCTMPNGGASVVVQVTTGANGAYLVDHLPYATCTVAVTSLPVALAPTFDEDSGTTSPNGQTVVVLTSAAPEHLTADFGYVADTGVGDTVWLDLDSDGVQDAGEPGLGGVEVTVTSGGPDGLLSTAGDNLVVVTTTDDVGYYQVLGLPPGETLVAVTGGLPAGVSQTYDSDGLGTADQSETTLATGTFDPDQDFGYVGPNSIGDYVWLDLDADGVQDAGEPGLAGVGVDVTWFGPDGVEGTTDDLVFHATTDAAGAYLVDGLPNGDYSVVVASGVPAGWAASYDETGTANGMSTVTDLGADGPEDHLTADFGFTGTGRLCGTVWLDRVADGVLTAPSEATLPGIVIDVTWAGPDGVLGTGDDVVFHATTGADGGWCVEHMPPGPFQAAVDQTTLPPGTSVVYDEDSGLASPDGVIPGTLAPNEIRTGVDNAVRGTSSFGDLVWVDRNRNGTRDAGDPGADGVKVTATCLGADGVLGGGDDWTVVTTTAGGGSYRLDGLPACRFQVVFDTFPKGTTPYSDLDGGSPTVTTFDLGLGVNRVDVDVVLRSAAGLAATGAAIGGLLGLALLLVGAGVYLRLRSSRMTARA